MEKVECPDCGRKFNTKEAMVQHKTDKHAKHEPSVAVRKPKITFGKILTYTIIIFVIAGVGYTLIWALTSSSNPGGLGTPGSTHIHMDWKMYINGKPIDFSVSKYQKPHINQHVHMEGGNGDVIHVHATGVTMGFFLNSIVLKLDKDCLLMDTGESYCNSGDKTLKFYVNGKPNSELDKYILKNLDKILVSYGNDSEDVIKQQLASITDKAKQT